jgi:hypothetical protein
MKATAIVTAHPMGWHAPRGVALPWRYLVTGYPIRSPRDNASFLHDATEDYRRKPVTVLSRARWRRVLRRNAAVTVPLALEALAPVTWIPWWFGVTWLVLCGAAALAWLSVRLRKGMRVHNPYRWARTWRVRRDWQEPAAAVLVRVLGLSMHPSRARRLIELPHGWGTGDATVEDAAPKVARIWLPAGSTLDAGTKKRVTENVGKRLGIPSPVGEWNESGAAPFVDISGAPVPPREVSYASLLPAIARCKEDEIIVGRAAGGRFVTISLSADSPHVLMSGAAGTGKSVLVRVFLRQRIERGDGVIITDPKRFSHIRWAGKLPADRVVYAHRDADLHAAWIAVAEETARRIELPEEELELQRRVFVVAEELNAQIKKLTRYWQGERRRIMNHAKAKLADCVERCDGSKSDGLALALDEGLDEAELDPPTTSPAVVALQETVFMGRELRMHMVAAAQRASAGVFGGGGGDVRESFQGGRLIAKWDKKLWKMLVDTLDYVACPTGPRGIWGLAQGDEFIVFRAPFMDEAEMARACLAAAPVYGPVLGPQADRGSVEGESWPSVDVESPRLAITSAVTLAMAIDSLPGQDGPEALSMAAFRKAASRPGFPEPLAKPDGQPYGQREARLYDLGQLTDWRVARLANGH